VLSTGAIQSAPGSWRKGCTRRSGFPIKEQQMPSNFMLSLIVGAAVSVGGSSLARAESTSSNEPGSQTADAQATQPKETKKTKKAKKHPNKTELDKLERGNPHSVIYKSRKKSAPNPSDAQIQAGESGGPHSVDNANRKASDHNTTNAEINAGEKGNPDAVK
jgi:hypothetical protein